MIFTFLMVSMCSITMQSLGEIEQCCRCENVVFTSRIAESVSCRY